MKVLRPPLMLILLALAVVASVVLWPVFALLRDGPEN